MSEDKNDIEKNRLLKDYMRRVIACEGMSYIDSEDYGQAPLTDEQREELSSIEEGIRAEGRL